MISGLDVHYDLGEGHPLLGRRMPDLDLVTADWHGAGVRAAARRPARAAQPRRARRPRHRSVGRPRVGDRRRLRRRSGSFPLLGEVPAPAAVLIRPDGHVAWVGEGTDTGLARCADDLVRITMTRPRDQGVTLVDARPGTSRAVRVVGGTAPLGSHDAAPGETCLSGSSIGLRWQLAHAHHGRRKQPEHA